MIKERIEVTVQDITSMNVDVVVNAADNSLLAGCYRSCFDLAAEHDLKSIAFPAISTGAYGYPAEQAARIAVGEARRTLAENSLLEQVIFVCFNSVTKDIYEALLYSSDR